MSVLHNPARECASIYPKRSDATRRTAAGFPRRANLLKIDARTCRSVTYTDRKVTGHYPLTQPLEAAHLGRHQAAACWPAIAPQQALGRGLHLRSQSTKPLQAGLGEQLRRMGASSMARSVISMARIYIVWASMPR